MSQVKTPLFQPFIMESLRVLTEEMHARARGEGNFRAGARPFDSGGSERLPNGTLLSKGADCDAATTDWHVYVLCAIDAASRAERYRFRGTIEASLTSEQFLAKAYTFILERNIDEGGRATYSSLLHEGKLTRRAILKILARSAEADQLESRYIIQAVAGSEPDSSLAERGQQDLLLEPEP